MEQHLQTSTSTSTSKNTPKTKTKTKQVIESKQLCSGCASESLNYSNHIGFCF